MAGKDDREKKGFSGLSELVSDISDANLPLSAEPQKGAIAPPIPKATPPQPKQTVLSPVSGNPSPNGGGGENPGMKFFLFVIVGCVLFFFLLGIINNADKEKMPNSPQAASRNNTHAQSKAAAPAASTITAPEASDGEYARPPIGRDNVLSSGSKSDPATSATRIDSPSVATRKQTPTSLPTSPPVLTYRVVAGDTLAKVASKHGVTLNMLLNANPDIISPDTILVGASLTIPLQGEAGESPGTEKANPTATFIPRNASQVNPPTDMPKMDKIDSSVEDEKMIDSVETEADLSDKSVDRAIWTRLKRGMSKSQVRAILGEPQSTQHSIFETWYYTARQDNSSPHVTFDGDRLVNWNERNSTVPKMDKIDSSVEDEKMIDSVETEADLSDKSVDRAIWTRLKRGMSKSQVRAILGEPQSTQHSIFETWYYTARQDNSSPHVTFDGDRLVNWNERNSTVPKMDKIDSSVEDEKMIDSVETEADLSDKSVDRAIWTRLKRGMSKSQVRAILGEPQSTQHSIFETWYYTARQDNSSPHVTFDGDRLVNWNEPNSHEYTAAKSKNAVDGVNKPAKPLPTPASGTIKQYHASDSVAPLTIRTRGLGQNYFVKLTEWTTGRIVATVFIRGGQSVDFKMPLGSYKMKYAAGATWYGESELFGPDTSYSEADSRFDFVDNGNQFSGYTVELYLQQNGNLETRKISPSEF